MHNALDCTVCTGRLKTTVEKEHLALIGYAGGNSHQRL